MLIFLPVLLLLFLQRLQSIPRDSATFKIINILDDGAVKMNRYQEDGALNEKKVLSSSFAIFTKKYSVTKNVRSVKANWPDDVYSQQAPFLDLKAVSRAQFMLCELCESVEMPTFEIQEKPHAGIFTKDAYLTGKFKLVPYGQIKLDGESVDVPPKCFEVKGKLRPDKLCYIRLTPTSDDNGVNPLTHIRYIDGTDEEEPSAKFEYRHMTLSGGHKISIPIVTNKGKLKKGAEVTLAKTWTKDEPATKVKRNVHVSCGIQEAKRARASNSS